jgi:hypothetical protein
MGRSQPLSALAVLVTAGLIAPTTHAQTKAAELLAHCDAARGGDEFCRGFVDATLDSTLWYPTENEKECFFDEITAPPDRLAEMAKAAMLEIKPADRWDTNALPHLRAYFRDPQRCRPRPPRSP